MSKLSRRQFLNTSLVAAGGLTLAACGAKETTSENTSVTTSGAPTPKVDIRFLNECVGSKEIGRTYLLGAFNAASDQISVQHDGYGGADTVHQKFITALSGGLVPDLYHNEANYIPGYVAQDALTDLGPYLEKSTRISKGDILERPLDLCTFDGKLWGIPFWGDGLMLYYNKNLLIEAGFDPDKPPQDWDTFREMATKITKRDSGGELLVSGISLDSWSIMRSFQDTLYSWGGQLLTTDLKSAAFNSNEGKEALQMLVDLILVDKVGEVGWGGEFENSPNEPFIAEKQAFMFDVPAAASRIKNNRPDFVNWSLTSLPKGKVGFATVSRPPALMIPKGAKNKDAAWRVIEYWLDSNVMTRWAIDIYRAPTTKSASNNELLKADPIIAPVVEALKNTADTPKTKHWAEMYNLIGAELELALIGDKTPSQALDDAATAVNKILPT